jgi:hypothetical protein
MEAMRLPEYGFFLILLFLLHEAKTVCGILKRTGRKKEMRTKI